MPWFSSCTARGRLQQSGIQAHIAVALIGPLLLAFSGRAPILTVAVVPYTELTASNAGVQACQDDRAAELTPAPVSFSRRAEMRAKTFSALSAKGWMMVSRSWYSRKRCVADALCQLSACCAFSATAEHTMLLPAIPVTGSAASLTSTAAWAVAEVASPAMALARTGLVVSPIRPCRRQQAVRSAHSWHGSRCACHSCILSLQLGKALLEGGIGACLIAEIGSPCCRWHRAPPG